MSASNILVAPMPGGWSVICLECIDSSGTPMWISDWTLRSEANAAAKTHRAEHAAVPVCESCGHRLADIYTETEKS